MLSNVKKFFLYFLLLFSVSLLHAQKVSRATEALLDAKYTKAADLYEEVLKKDSINVVAHVGLTKTRLKQYETAKQVQPLSDYVLCLQNLKKTKYLFSYVDKDDKKLLNEKLFFFSSAQVEDLRQSLSSILWNEFFSKNMHIDSIQLFYDEYSFGEKIKEAALKRLSTLHYERIQYSSNLKDFKEFVGRFKTYPETDKAIEDIQRLEITEALLSESPQLLESALKKYPYSKQEAELKAKLAQLYYSSVDSTSEENRVNKVIRQLRSLNDSLANQFIDSCNTFLFKMGYKNLANSDSKESIRDFLNKYTKYKNEHAYIEMQKRKLELIFSNLNSSSSSINYSELHEFISEAPADYDGLSELLNTVITDINLISLARLDNCIKQFIDDSISISTAYKGVLFKLLRAQFLTQFFVDTTLLYIAVKELDHHLSEDEYVTGIIDNLRLMDQVTIPSISIKSISSDDIGLVTLRIRVRHDSTVKRQYFLSNSDEVYILAPDLKTNLPIYAGISRKNEITSFTKPEIVGYNNGQYDVQVFGAKAFDAPCCPSSKIIIVYEESDNTLNPKSLRSLTSSEGDINELEDGEYRQLKVTLGIASSSNSGRRGLGDL
jgi:hypothetical protein